MNFVSVTREVTNPLATLVLLHGLGSDEKDMAGLANMIDDRVEVICLRAPHRYGPGYAWFDIQWTNTGIEVDEAQYWGAVDLVKAEVERLARPKLIVGGFSQGAMVSLGVVSRYPDLAKACLLLSGRGIEKPAPQFKGQVFQAHGMFDDVIPIQDARKLHESLKSLGDQYEYHEYEMGHWINEEELSDLNHWLRRLIEG